MIAPIIYQPGVYPDMTNDDYHGGAGISKTGLDWIDKCPSLFDAKYNTKEIEDKETSALSVGKAGHLAVFQPDIFDSEVATLPEINRRTKEGRQEYADFLEDNTGKTIITPDEYETVRRVAESVRKDPIANSILSGSGMAETSIFATDEETGELIKVRPDWMTEDLLVDLKSILCASGDYFSKELYNRRYYVQAPYYLDTANLQFKNRFNAFLFIAVEKTPPYVVSVYYASPETIELGRAKYRENLNTYHSCKSSGVWPGYTKGKITEVGMPRWASDQIKREIYN